MSKLSVMTRDRQTDRHRDGQTDTKTDRQTDTETDRHRDRQTGTETEAKRDRWADRQFAQRCRHSVKLQLITQCNRRDVAEKCVACRKTDDSGTKGLLLLCHGDRGSSMYYSLSANA